MTGQKIYENFTNGAGPDGLSGGAAIVNEVAAGYGERAEAIRRITEKMEAAWQGEAAGAARRGTGPLGVEHELAGVDLATAQDLTNRQAGSFADARNAMVPVPPEPTAPDPWAVFTSPGKVVSYRQQVADHDTANQHNVDVMTGYAGASSYNTQGMPQSFGALSDDQAGIAIDSGTSDPGGPRGGGQDSGDGSRGGGRSGGEWTPRTSDWTAPPPGAGADPDSGAAVPPHGGSGSQPTTPGGATPAAGGPAVPVGSGGGSGPPTGGPSGGLPPEAGLVPVGGGLNDGSGGRGPGGRGVGVPGAGSGSEVRGPGGRAGGGEPHGSGGRPGVGPFAGGTAGEPHAAGRGGPGGAAGRAGALGGMPMAGGGRGRSEEDSERYAPEYLQEDDPEGLFGTDELTAPPVIGEDLESPEPDEPLSAG